MKTSRSPLLVKELALPQRRCRGCRRSSYRRRKTLCPLQFMDRSASPRGAIRVPYVRDLLYLVSGKGDILTLHPLSVYLLHAYDYCPEDPLVCLCLAVASIGRAMQRQADNRHHLITQGMGFLTRYKALRGEDTDDMMDEIEYNFGRAFHQLGMSP